MSRARRRERVDRGIKVRSESLYVLTSVREIAYLALPRVLLVVGLLVLPLVLGVGSYWSRVLLSTLLVALLALSFDFLAHYVGLACLGGAFLFGVGGYATALLNAELGLPPVLSIPLGSVLGALLCTVLILPCLPLRGIYFAVVTLMYPLLGTRVIEATGILGGTDGFRGIDGLGSPWAEQYVLIAILLLAVFGLRRLVTEAPGLVLQAIRDNDQAVRASGISVTWWKAKALFLAALLGCFAGAWYAHLYRNVGVSAFALDYSILPIAATIVGGPRTLAGPVLGCLILVPLGELLRDFGSLRIATYAVILTAVIVLVREGLLPFAARKYHQFERWVDA